MRSRWRREATRCARARPRGLPRKSRSWSGNIGGPGPISSASLKTGKPAFEHVFGMSVSDWRARTPSKAPCSTPIWRRRRWRRPGPSSQLWICRARSTSPISAAAMAGCSPPCCMPIRSLKRFCSTARTSIEAARPFLESLGIARRVTFVAGDFLAAIPVQADLYLLKGVLQQWDDDAARAILRNCREAMPEGATLAIIERLIARARHRRPSRDHARPAYDDDHRRPRAAASPTSRAAVGSRALTVHKGDADTLRPRHHRSRPG